jgi:hypothetical protein
MQRLSVVPALLFLVLLGVGSCSGSQGDAPDGGDVPCTPFSTRACVGASNCVGGQLCNSSGEGYTGCICENEAGEIDVDGSFFPVGGGKDGSGGKSDAPETTEAGSPEDGSKMDGSPSTDAPNETTGSPETGVNEASGDGSGADQGTEDASTEDASTEDAGDF